MGGVSFFDAVLCFPFTPPLLPLPDENPKFTAPCVAYATWRSYLGSYGIWVWVVEGGGFVWSRVIGGCSVGVLDKARWRLHLSVGWYSMAAACVVMLRWCSAFDPAAWDCDPRPRSSGTVASMGTRFSLSCNRRVGSFVGVWLCLASPAVRTPAAPLGGFPAARRRSGLGSVWPAWCVVFAKEVMTCV